MDTTSRGKRKRSLSRQEQQLLQENGRTLLDQVTRPDFEEFARRYPDFSEAWQELQQRKEKYPSSSLSTLITPDFNISLTRALLHFHFGLSLPSLPKSRLCPPVPNRFFYVRWIQIDLLPLLDNKQYFVQVAKNVITDGSTKQRLHRYGCDIGTGASCIYPLLFHSNLQHIYPQLSSDNAINKWMIVATDIDPVSIEAAKDNVRSNQIEDIIKIFKVSQTRAQYEQSDNLQESLDDCHSMSGGPICHAFEAFASELQQQSTASMCSTPLFFDFVMTNPPFYDDLISTERTDLRAVDARERTPMTCEEGSYPGGEVGFVLDMIRDCLQYSDQLGWCTCMCGKKSSFNKLKGLLIHLLGPSHLVVTEFGPGHMTRWFLAWTLRRPHIRSPLGRFGGQRVINVNIASAMSGSEAVVEVTNRLRLFVTSINDLTLAFDVTEEDNSNPTCIRAHIREAKVKSGLLMVDQAANLPARISKGLSAKWDAMDFLPLEGRFVIDVAVTHIGTQSSDSVKVVQVSLDCFRHAKDIEEVVQKILNQMEGEICRSNRRWRRLLKGEALNRLVPNQELAHPEY